MKLDFDQATSEQLISVFVEKSLLQYRAELHDETVRWIQIYRELEAITSELKLRAGDQRRKLMSLYAHENMQVCVNAAISTLAVAPAAARAELETIAAWPHCAQRVQALDMLDALASGRHVPG